jgi:hypothetical protein
MYTELTTDHMIDIEPQDEAMDCFRKHFHMVANCNVTGDGKLMIYRIKGESTTWLNHAKNIIKTRNLPLIAELISDVCGTFIHIIYKPQ